MVRANFSEFSYGFAVTHRLVNSLPGVQSAPEFPSLRDEASLGYDLRLQYPGFPIYLQFKLSDWLSRPTAREWAWHQEPYYRVPITPRMRSDQHNLLKGLVDAGEDAVYYVAPLFHTLDDFNAAYAGDQIVSRSAWFRLQDLPRLSDDEEHCITLTRSSGFVWHTSGGERFPHDVSGSSVLTTIRSHFEADALRPIDEEFFQVLRAKLISVLTQNNISGLPIRSIDHPSISDALRDIRFLLTTYYCMEMLILRKA